jgi:fatty acid-binding protein DegV
VRIFTDSTCDLSAELLLSYQIEVVPLYVIFGDKSFKDGVTIKPDRFYEWVDQFGKLPKLIQDSDDIVYIGLSSELSSTIQNATIAAAGFPDGRVTVIDSRNLSTSTGIGLLVLKG